MRKNENAAPPRKPERLFGSRLPLGGRWLSIAFTVGLMLLPAVAWGCPTCKDGFDPAATGDANLARGYFYSILIMLAMPFTLAGSFGAYVWREMRRQKLDAASWQPESASDDPRDVRIPS
jgi:hypothetical protein